MNTLSHSISLTTLVLFGLMGGFFYAFSVCVMGGLNRIAPDSAIMAMQSINVVVRNPMFFFTFFCTPLISLAAALSFMANGQRPVGLFFAWSALIYVIVVIIVTMVVNVPMNEALALVDPAAPDNAETWKTYSERWTFWNTVRAFGGSAALLVAVLGYQQAKLLAEIGRAHV